MISIFCQNCGNKIAVVNDSGSYTIRHQGRGVLALDVLEIHCENCDTVWKKGDPTGRVQTVQYVRLAAAIYRRG